MQCSTIGRERPTSLRNALCSTRQPHFDSGVGSIFSYSIGAGATRVSESQSRPYAPACQYSLPTKGVVTDNSDLPEYLAELRVILFSDVAEGVRHDWTRQPIFLASNLGRRWRRTSWCSHQRRSWHSVPGWQGGIMLWEWRSTLLSFLEIRHYSQECSDTNHHLLWL